jgi:MurNAc alpha-1-phosphate uridylyltransferase
MISAQIMKPELFTAIAAQKFSNSQLWDELETQGRLYGLVHDGTCYHVGTPHDLAEANRLLTAGSGWAIS